MSATEKSLVERTTEPTSPLIDERLRLGLAVMWRAFICSHDTGAKLWDLSLPVRRLHEAGLTGADLRWLIAKGFVEHGEETTNYGDPHRSFRFSNNYFLNDRSCLILTASGAALAEHIFSETVRLPSPALSKPTIYEVALKPRWDAVRRELSLAGVIVKRFRVPAQNQELILSVFEEESWVEHIHDPLPATLDIDAPTRLHDAINRLNRSQINPLVRFHGDGKGTGIFWKVRRGSEIRG